MKTTEERICETDEFYSRVIDVDWTRWCT